jgi:PRTRC genetic system ThiF family protein
VDTRKARADIYREFGKRSHCVWIDCGNTATTGQVVLGARFGGRTVAPCVADLFPEIVDAKADDHDTQPSCSVAEALARQDLMTNRFMADAANNLLWRMLRYGEMEHHGVFVDVPSGRSTPMPVDPNYWASLGWSQMECKQAA